MKAMKPTKNNKPRQAGNYVNCTGGKVRTADNRLNAWVRSLDDGKFYRTR